jgi:ribose transport system permease protein
MISSFFASLAGVMYVFQFITGRAPAGSARLIDAVVAVVIGGASLYGGKGTIIGTVIGALIIGALEIGLVNLSIPTYNLYIAVGCILIFAVLIDQFSPELIQKEEEI